MDALQDFVSRCDAYAKAAGVSRVTVSKKLFGQTRKLDDLANGKVDVGYLRLVEAIKQLGLMEAEAATLMPSTAHPPPDHVEV